MNEYRREIKFVLEDFESNYLIDQLKARINIKQEWEDRYINSIYFDDQDMSSAIANLSGISARNKLRLRWYSKFDYMRNLNSQLFLEIKRKKNFLSYKNIHNFNVLDKNTKINFRNIDRIVNNFILEQKLNLPYLNSTIFVTYLRKYFVLNKSIRITLDREVNFYDTILNSYPSKNNRSNFRKSILEIKFNERDFEKVKDILQILKRSPMRNSKYLRGLSHLGKIRYL